MGDKNNILNSGVKQSCYISPYKLFNITNEQDATNNLDSSFDIPLQIYGSSKWNYKSEVGSPPEATRVSHQKLLNPTFNHKSVLSPINV